MMHLLPISRIPIAFVCLASPFANTGHGVDISSMDRSVVVKSPADMYNFANGSWFDRTAIPADKSYVGAFDDVIEHNLAILKSVAEKAATSSAGSGNSPADLVGTLYREALDEDSLEAMGSSPPADQLREIDRISYPSSLLAVIAHLDSLSVDVGFRVTVQPDAKNSSRMLLALSQGGVILPDRQLYLDSDDRSKAIRAQYITTLSKLMTLAKMPDPLGQATASLGLETVLAKASSTPAELRSPQENYHLTKVSDLAVLAPSVDWNRFFERLGASHLSSVNVCQPKFLTTFSETVSNVPVGQWRSYLRCAVLYAWAPYLSNVFVKTQFSLISDITGTTLLAPRWKRAITVLDSILGDAVGQLLEDLEYFYSSDALPIGKMW